MSDPVHGILFRHDAVNVAHVVERCRVLGPGERFVLWVQGCPLRCPGCHNPDFLAFRDATWVDVDVLRARIMASPGIEGVTYAGGEPFAQAGALARLARAVRRSGLTVMAYSGYAIEELASGTLPDARLLLDSLDLLMDGPYRQELPTQKPWRGSDNQRLLALSARYADRVEAWNRPTGQDFEVRVHADGTLEVLGIPPVGLVAQLHARPAAGGSGPGGCGKGTDRG